MKTTQNLRKEEGDCSKIREIRRIFVSKMILHFFKLDLNKIITRNPWVAHDNFDIRGENGIYLALVAENKKTATLAQTITASVGLYPT